MRRRERERERERGRGGRERENERDKETLVEQKIRREIVASVELSLEKC